MMKLFRKVIHFCFFICLVSCSHTDNKKNDIFRVSKACSSSVNCFSSVQNAIDASAELSSEEWVTIKIEAGDYYEKVVVKRPKTRIVGAGLDKARIFFDAFARDSKHYHRDAWGTAGSATLTINADMVELESLTIENTFDYLANDALDHHDPDKIRASQAVSVLLDINSDRVSLNKVSLLGYQDTLFANGARAYISNSLIAGNVDFIFGNGQVFIENSEILSRRRAQMNEGQAHSYITAASTQLENEFGIVIYKSRLLREDGIPDYSVSLGRPWHPTTNFSDGRYADPNAVGQVSFVECYMDKHIFPARWSSMNGTARDGTKTDVFTPESSRFQELRSYGPGRPNDALDFEWQAPWMAEQIFESHYSSWVDRK